MPSNSTTHTSLLAVGVRASVAAGVAIQCEYLVFLTLVQALDVNYIAASLLSSGVGIALNLWAHHTWVYRQNEAAFRQRASRYLAVVALGVAIGLVLLWAAVDLLGMRPLVARVLADLVTFVVWMYPACRAFVYVPRPGDPHYAARVLAYYGRQADEHSSEEATGIAQWFWRRQVRPREFSCVMQMVAPAAGESVLDVGCGSGVYARPLGGMGLAVCAVDASPDMVAAVRPHVSDARVADIETLALGRLFDKVICIGVLEFVADPAGALARLADHLRPGGRLVVLVPSRSVGGLVYLLTKVFHGIHHHLFSVRQLRRMAAERGLRLVAWRRPLPHNVVLAWERV